MTEAVVPYVHRTRFTTEQIALIKRTICKGATNDEFAFFMAQCDRTQLDPFSRQIYAIRRWDSSQNCYVMQTQISIDGSRLTAERTNKYGGQQPAQWCGMDGIWHDVWLDSEPPAAAKVGVIRTDFKEPIVCVASNASYVQTAKSGEANSMWRKMSDVMIAKCAESLALRKAFPNELSGLYTTEEMGQADVEQPISTQSLKRTEELCKKTLDEELVHTVEYEVIEPPEEEVPFEERVLIVDMKPETARAFQTIAENEAKKATVTPPNFNLEKTPEQGAVLNKMTLVGHRNETLALFREAKWNSFKQAGHIAKWFKKTQFSELTIEELVTLKEQIREDIEAQKTKTEQGKIPARLMMPENLGEEEKDVSKN